jgi:hypothetical protein
MPVHRRRIPGRDNLPPAFHEGFAVIRRTFRTSTPIRIAALMCALSPVLMVQDATAQAELTVRRDCPSGRSTFPIRFSRRR